MIAYRVNHGNLYKYDGKIVALIASITLPAIFNRHFIGARQWLSTFIARCFCVRVKLTKSVARYSGVYEQ